MEPSLARRLWQAIEPIHAVAYFHPEPTEALKRQGLRGWWMSYFAGRFAPVGAVGPGPVTAMAFGFAPRMVERALPDAWRFVPPDVVLETRLESVTTALRSTLPIDGGAGSTLAELSGLLTSAARACRYEGRPLAAGWLDVDPGADDLTRIWTAATVLREHRGDGHVIAAVSLDLRGLDTALSHVATGAVTRDLIQPNRGWTDEEWDEAERRLEARGVLDRDRHLTEHGESLRRQLEEATDRLALAPAEQLGESGVERVVELAAPLSRHLMDTGVIPVPNPIGVPRP